LVFIDRYTHSSIINIKSITGAECDSDHNSVVEKVMERPSVCKHILSHDKMIGKQDEPMDKGGSGMLQRTTSDEELGGI
jgi:hypothetical protein